MNNECACLTKNESYPTCHSEKSRLTLFHETVFFFFFFFFLFGESSGFVVITLVFEWWLGSVAAAAAGVGSRLCLTSCTSYFSQNIIVIEMEDLQCSAKNILSKKIIIQDSNFLF